MIDVARCIHIRRRLAEDEMARIGRKEFLPLFSQITKAKQENIFFVELDNSKLDSNVFK